ncbi:MAG: oligoendopeptidase F [Candidatus Hydrogenedentes bacterium]|nr:oligoendopeptidase F [Candidatus Hydrogenedentota bacterium]
MSKKKSIPARDAVKTEDAWDLTKIFKSDAAWEKAHKKLEKMIPTFATFRGKLGKSAKQIRACLDFEAEFGKLAERVGVYAYLKSTEDVANSTYQGMVARYMHVATLAGEAASFIAPEMQAIPKQKMNEFMKAPQLAEFRFQLRKLVRYRPHILSEKEERLLAMQGEVAGSASNIFEQLNDADLTFGTVVDETGAEVELSQSSFRSLLESPKRAVRKEAFTRFYQEYAAHGHTLAATLSSSVLQDVYQSKVRNHPSVVESALFSDNVPLAVYDNLIETVHKNLDTVYRYLALRKRALKLKALHTYDTYAPIVRTPKVNIPYDEAVSTICDALAPLGDGYVNIMRKGLLDGRWVDRYENQGKRSGAFSYGAYGTPPYIMMNYKDDVLDSMYTLAHEAGHSMHTHYSAKHQPYQYSHYTIFVAEVASTFNEQLLGKHLFRQARTKTEKARLINKEIDEIRGTIIRQTMFAEFERIIHAIAEAGQPLTLDVLRAQYRGLLETYFGPDFVIDEALELECLRIPHFYNAFYVYKYATGLSAAIALSETVASGGAKERDRYLSFLQSGGSKFPLDLLKDAGVDLTTPAPVDAAMARFAYLVDELEALV